ncbi:hypothetical protein FDA33_09235 [Clostridium botulinum]|nr:hypothetical protein [Clostridium botulinum]NFI18085.1 hypothetical protein [Clostridium botulinum]NFL93051.1 hypothetical protein [Clostridium botulinum]NFN51626.1 hypothetical protein [Clostridium botulinum]NFO27250.1 hypothetical protein [Clostridium botulinum]
MNKELLVKGVNEEIIRVLNAFDGIINADFSNEVTITTGEGVITRKATLQDNIELIQSEWSDTKERLSELGIEVNSEAPKNHYEVYGKLADGEKEKYLDFNGMSVNFNSAFIDENGEGDSILILHRNDIEGPIATIILKFNKEYEIIESEHGCSFELIEK